MGNGVDWFEALGAKKPESAAADTGVNGQEPAPPADTGVNGQEPAPPADTGANLQEPAPPADNGKEKNLDNPAADNSTNPAESGTEQKPSDKSADGNSDKLEMSKEERAKNAARRREAEMQEKIEAVRAEERQKLEAEREQYLDQSIAALQLVNPFTNERIRTRAEYDDFLRARDEQTINAGLEQAGIDRAVIDAIVNQHPDVIKARELAVSAEREKMQAQDMSAEEKAKAELAEIQKYDPSLKSLEDLFALPNYSDIRRFVGAGATISEAYRLVNHDLIVERERKAAAQEVFNTINSKAHLTPPDAPRGEGGITIPAGVKKTYRQLYPGISDVDIQKKYEKIVRKKG